MWFVITESDGARWIWRLFWRDEVVAQADHDFGSEALARDGAREFARDLSVAERTMRRR